MNHVPKGRTPIHERRVLIIGSDGLRPDMIRPETMPNYCRLMNEGTLLRRFQSTYPSLTRVCMSSLTTGVYSGKHGVVNNKLYLPGFQTDGFLQTGNHHHLFDFARTTGAPLLMRPTLGDRLHKTGKHLAVAGAGSPGSSLLWNLNHPEMVINPDTTYDTAAMEEVRRILGPAPDKDHMRDRLRWVVRGLVEHHLPDPRNRALVLWLSEPDAVCHKYGPGAPEVYATLQWVDECIGLVLEARDRLNLQDSLDLLFVSDHGHSTLQHVGKLETHLAMVTCELGCLDSLLCVGNYIYQIAPIGEDVLQKLILWLKEQPWCGAVLANHPKSENWGAIPLETLMGPIEHERAPLLVVNPTWSEEKNEFGLPGIVQSLTAGPKMSSHGHAVPTDMRAFGLGWGPSFRQGHISEVPCGLVDVAPTVCHMLGLDGQNGFDGRVLHETLCDEINRDAPQSITKIVGHDHRQPIEIAEVEGRRYILGSRSSL